MFDITKAKVHIPCPKCEQKLEVTIQDIRNRETILCPHCQQKIVLNPDSSVDASIQKVNKTLDRLKNIKIR